MILRTLGLILIGIVAAMSAVVLAASLRHGERSDGPSAAEKVALRDVEISMAAKAMPAMSVVDASSITQKSVRAADVPRGAVTSAVSVIGRVLIAPVVEGQVFTDACFATKGSDVHLASAIRPGMRAMSVSMTNYQSLYGLLYPGSLVDVLVSFDVPTLSGYSQEPVATTLLQSVEVLAIEDKTIVSGSAEPESASPAAEPARDRSTNRQGMVTLMVSPVQAEALHLATVHGKVSLVLRNPLDAAPTVGRGMFLHDISAELAERMAALAAQPPSFPATVLPGPAVGPAPQPVAPSTGPVAAPAPAEPAAKTVLQLAEEQKKWQTIIFRGTTSETRTFPVTP